MMDITVLDFVILKMSRKHKTMETVYKHYVIKNIYKGTYYNSNTVHV